MPVGAPPTPEQLEKLRAQTERLLAEATLCLNGGRVITQRKIGGLSARKVAYWVEKGEYPAGSIPACGHDELCVDCGRFAVDPQPAEPAPVVAPPPPVPAPAEQPPVAAKVVPVVEPPERGQGPVRDPGLLPALVPGPVPPGRRPPVWLWRAVLGAAALVVLVVSITVAVQGASFGVSTVRESVPKLDVQHGGATTTSGM